MEVMDWWLEQIILVAFSNHNGYMTLWFYEKDLLIQTLLWVRAEWGGFKEILPSLYLSTRGKF